MTVSSDEPHESLTHEEQARKLLTIAAKELPDKGLLVMVTDIGPGGHVGYMSNIKRDDGVLMVMEWLSRAIPSMGKEGVKHLLQRIENEWEQMGSGGD